jgi:uncharacterized protein
MDDFALSHFHVVSPRFVDERDGAARRVVFATRSGEVRVLDDGLWQLIATGRIAELDETLVTELARIELLIRPGEDELASVMVRNNVAINSNAVLSLVVCPSASCQLGCPYCGQEHSRRWLSEFHQTAFLGMVERKLRGGSYKVLELCWFGAEPLLGIRVIRSFTPRIREIAEKYGCRYKSRIITNGLALTPTVATELVEQHSVAGIDVTLDGSEEAHDGRRSTKTGRGTFARIFRNLVSLASRDDLDVEIKLRTNVDASNWQSVSPLIRMLAEAGVQRRIGYYFAPVHSWGNQADKASLPRKEFAAREIEWFAEMMLQGYNVGLIPPRKPIVCLAVQHDGLVVDAAGALFNCTEVPYVPAYDDGTYRIGNVIDGETSASRRTLGDFNKRVTDGEYPCSTCRMLPVCGGACPKGWLEGWQPCPSALDNMPERLLLAYASSLQTEANAS